MNEEDFQKIADLIDDFDDFAWCECSECKYVANSHAINIDRTMQNLIKYLREKLEVV